MADRSFGPTLLLGVGGAVLAATAGHRPWLELTAPGSAQGAADWFWENNPGIGEMPAAGALGLVALATWGVLLVSRGVTRRVVAALGLLASLGLGVTWVVGAATLTEDVEAKVVEAGLADGWELGWTPWFVVAGVAVLMLVPAHLVALLRVPRWPAMGSRYDAPAASSTASPAASPTASPATSTGGRTRAVGPAGAPADGEVDPADVWRAIDEGRDPTA